jgi:hypothetical protein
LTICLWEVRDHDATTARLDCRIHFAVSTEQDQGRTVEIRDAFQYDWRLWTPRELIDALPRCGYVPLWRHTYHSTKGAAGVFLGPVAPDAVDGLDQWTAYMVASV